MTKIAQRVTAAVFCLFLAGFGLAHVLLPDRDFSPFHNRDTFVPSPSLLSMRSLAPWSFAIWLQRARPRPLPPALRPLALSTM